jgi:hypothetical protein
MRFATSYLLICGFCDFFYQNNKPASFVGSVEILVFMYFNVSNQRNFSQEMQYLHNSWERFAKSITNHGTSFSQVAYENSLGLDTINCNLIEAHNEGGFSGVNRYISQKLNPQILELANQYDVSAYQFPLFIESENKNSIKVENEQNLIDLIRGINKIQLSDPRQIQIGSIDAPLFINTYLHLTTQLLEESPQFLELYIDVLRKNLEEKDQILITLQNSSGRNRALEVKPGDNLEKIFSDKDNLPFLAMYNAASSQEEFHKKIVEEYEMSQPIKYLLNNLAIIKSSSKDPFLDQLWSQSLEFVKTKKENFQNSSASEPALEVRDYLDAAKIFDSAIRKLNLGYESIFTPFFYNTVYHTLTPNNEDSKNLIFDINEPKLEDFQIAKYTYQEIIEKFKAQPSTPKNSFRISYLGGQQEEYNFQRKYNPWSITSPGYQAPIKKIPEPRTQITNSQTLDINLDNQIVGSQVYLTWNRGFRAGEIYCKYEIPNKEITFDTEIFFTDLKLQLKRTLDVFQASNRNNYNEGFKEESYKLFDLIFSSYYRDNKYGSSIEESLLFSKDPINLKNFSDKVSEEGLIQVIQNLSLEMGFTQDLSM